MRYLVKWRNYGLEHNTSVSSLSLPLTLLADSVRCRWEPRRSFGDFDFVKTKVTAIRRANRDKPKVKVLLRQCDEENARLLKDFEKAQASARARNSGSGAKKKRASTSKTPRKSTGSSTRRRRSSTLTASGAQPSNSLSASQSAAAKRTRATNNSSAATFTIDEYYRESRDPSARKLFAHTPPKLTPAELSAREQSPSDGAGAGGAGGASGAPVASTSAPGPSAPANDEQVKKDKHSKGKGKQQGRKNKEGGDDTGGLFGEFEPTASDFDHATNVAAGSSTANGTSISGANKGKGNAAPPPPPPQDGRNSFGLSSLGDSFGSSFAGHNDQDSDDEIVDLTFGDSFADMDGASGVASLLGSRCHWLTT